MNLLLLIESLKFHRVRQETAVRILFLLCTAVNAGVYFFPGSDPDLAGLFNALQAASEGQMTMPTFTDGNLLFMGLSLAAALITLICTFTYAALFAGGNEDMPTRSILLGLLRALPLLAVCGVLLVVPAIFSVFLFFIPMIIVFLVLYFLPLNLILGRMRLSEAMAASFRDTRRARMVILLQYMMLMIVMNVPESLLLNVLPVSGVAVALIGAFFQAATAMMRGRLMGIFYLNLVKKVPVVIPSKPTV